jgi:hypothetical protein
VPVGVLVLVVAERLDDVVAGFGVKAPVAPVGNPVTLRVTWPLKPKIGVMVML